MNTKKTIYLDMDGVVADWVKGAAEIVGYDLDDPNQHYPDIDWQKVRSCERMFLNLPKMPGADELVTVARRFRDELDWQLMFLTAIPHYNDIHWAFWDKTLWVQSRYPDIPVHFGPYSEDKQKHCRPGDILVDDRPDNCERWRGAEGVAVRVYPRAVPQATQELAALFDQLKAEVREKHLG
jgi:5'(3')-deoxyribonucleotidase